MKLFVKKKGRGRLGKERKNPVRRGGELRKF